MQTKIAHASQRNVLTLEGCFDMDAQFSFRKAYRKLLLDMQGSEMVLDMGAVEHMDASAVGGLLLLQKEAKPHTVAVRLSGCRPRIRQILATAHVDRLFTLTAA